MRNKAGVLILVILLVAANSIAVLSADEDDYAPRIYEGWDSAKGNMLTNFWHGVNFFADNQLDPNEDVDTYGWYVGTFFGLAQWEKEICLADLSSDVRQRRDIVSTHNEEDQVYTTTVTVSSIKTPSFNSSLYEVSWYLASYGQGNSGLQFRIYLDGDNNNKEYIIGKDGNASGAFTAVSQSSAGFEARYLVKNYTRVVLEYNFGGSGSSQTFSARIVNAGEAASQQQSTGSTSPVPSGGTPPPTYEQPSPTGTCPAPVTPKVNEIKVKEHGRVWDSTPIVTRNCDYCASIGMGTMGGQPRCSCPARPDGHPERPACEYVMMGGNPRWFCNGNEIQPSSNPYQASCSGSVKVCNADLSVCGTP